MKKIIHLSIVFMLIFGFLPIVLLTGPQPATAGTSPPPNDGVNGAYTQYIDGDWTITNTQSYTDEIIVLTGNLTIESGGALTLKNVTLMMNCTTIDGQYKLEVLNGGTLEIADKDNDPATIDDISNITDSPFDSDNNTGYDFEYCIRIEGGASFSLKNSLVREAGFGGFGSKNYGIYIETDNVIIQNTSFIHNYYGIYLSLVENATVCYNNFSYSVYGFGFYSSQDFRNRVYNNEIHHNTIGIQFTGENFKIYNNYIHNNTKTGVYLNYLDHTTFYNNTIKYNGGTSSDYNLEVYNCYNVSIYKNIIQNVDSGSFYAVKFSKSTFINFHNNTVTYNDKWGIQYQLMMNTINDFRFLNNNISNNNGTGLYIYGAFSMYYTMVEIRNNVFYNNVEDGLY
ncbi:MAG: right-handed parallel beta-helix repeat-containing protein, partial [Thermoplasmata archaeon]|nr:right-handed parallel beta-helix repeat-containing protein [Thermoplasmata archaeon]